jgi:hypothetical protein
MGGEFEAARASPWRATRVAFAWLIALALAIQGVAAVHHFHADTFNAESANADVALDHSVLADPALDDGGHKPHDDAHHRDCPACLVSALGLHVLPAAVTMDWPPSKDTQATFDLRQHPRLTAPREERSIRGPPVELNA